MLKYLASPYTDPDPAIRARRAREVCAVASEMIRRGYRVITPIGMFHWMAITCGLPTEANYWQELNRELLSKCHELWVLTLLGWQSSTGVNQEIIWARQLGIPIYLVNPANLERIQI